MSEIKLGYWGVRGAAQHLRFLLEYVGLPYEDLKYTDKDAWQKQKADLLKVNPLANLPYIKDGDQWYFENSSLAIFIAHKSGKKDLLGTNIDEKVAIKQLQSVIIGDFQGSLRKLFTNDQYNDTNLTASTKSLLVKLDFLLTGKTWSAGESITISDFLVFETADFCKNYKQDQFSNYPNVVRIHQKIIELPQIKQYLKSSKFLSIGGFRFPAQPKLILGYWKNRGRAQALRYLLEFLELPYEEKRYTLDAPQEWFGKDKVQYQNNPLANIPYIKDGDKVIFESLSLATYIVYKSNKLELLGTNMQEQVNLEALYSVLLDFQSVKYKHFLAPQENYVKENFLNDINPFLAKLQFLINGKQWATGNNMTYIDFFLFEATELIRQIDETTFKKYSNIVAFNQKFAEIPKIKNYINSDKFISSPFLNWF